jgi:hypothetical protein
MAFVNEHIPAEFFENFDFTKIKFPPGRKADDIERFKWTIDKSKNAFLLCLDAGGRGSEDEPRHEWLVLFTDDDAIYLDADMHFSAGDSKLKLKLTQARIKATTNDSLVEKELIELMREALFKRGWLFEDDSLSSLEIEEKLTTK